MSQSSLFTPTIVLITGHFSNSAKFCGKGQITRLGSKFRGPRKTMGPNNWHVLVWTSSNFACDNDGCWLHGGNGWWLSSVLRLCQHNIGHMGDDFYRS